MGNRGSFFGRTGALLLPLRGVLARGCDDGREYWIGLVSGIGGGDHPRGPWRRMWVLKWRKRRSTSVAGELGGLAYVPVLDAAVVEEAWV